MTNYPKLLWATSKLRKFRTNKRFIYLFLPEVSADELNPAKKRETRCCFPAIVIPFSLFYFQIN